MTFRYAQTQGVKLSYSGTFKKKQKMQVFCRWRLKLRKSLFYQTNFVSIIL